MCGRYAERQPWVKPGRRATGFSPQTLWACGPPPATKTRRCERRRPFNAENAEERTERTPRTGRSIGNEEHARPRARSPGSEPSRGPSGRCWSGASERRVAQGSSGTSRAPAARLRRGPAAVAGRDVLITPCATRSERPDQSGRTVPRVVASGTCFQSRERRGFRSYPQRTERNGAPLIPSPRPPLRSLRSLRSLRGQGKRSALGEPLFPVADHFGLQLGQELQAIVAAGGQGGRRDTAHRALAPLHRAQGSLVVFAQRVLHRGQRADVVGVEGAFEHAQG